MVTVNHATDAELVEQARLCGDKDAFGALLERHHAGALRLARRLVAQEETAHELVQEAMLAAYLSLASLAQPASFQSWLYGIVINVCRSYLRQRHFAPLSLDALAGGIDATPALLVSHAPDAHTLTEARELHELVLAAIDTLSPANRQAVMLFYYEQLSLREISLTLGISMSAVKGRLHKARRHLAGYFNMLADRDEWLPAPTLPARGISDSEGKDAMTAVEIVDVVVLEADHANDEQAGTNKDAQDQPAMRRPQMIVILLDAAGQRILPIWVGPFEGDSIALKLLGENLVPRPLTHDLMAALVQASGAVVEEIQISSLRESTYYATILLRVGDMTHKIDARPSDAMALALRLQSKLYVTDDILARAAKEIPAKYRNNYPRWGLEQMMARMEKAKREHEEMLEKFKQKVTQDVDSATDRLFAYVFGE